MYFALHPDINKMRSRPDSALSEIIATTLIIILVVALAAIIAVIVLDIPLLPEKPVLAGFNADTVMGKNRTSSLEYNVPVIRLYQMAGDSLIQEYTAGGHSAINGTKVKLVDPAGKIYTAVTAQSMTGKTLEKGEPFYIFHYYTVASEAPWIWITNNPSRVFTDGSGVEAFHPHGTWKLLITEEKDTNMIIYQQDINL
jgi:FlaG/FlaF family flagellin (archaellin)